MKRNRRAKIVATVGPASSDIDILRQLYQAGVDVFRLNFSHGTHEEHEKRYNNIRKLEEENGRPIGILQDLQGPKIRIGTLKDGEVNLVPGATIRFVPDHIEGDDERVTLPHPEVFSAMDVGHQLMIDDGKLRLEATNCNEDYIEARVVIGGKLKDRKGINLPETVLDLSPLTEKDRADLEYGLKLGVDWVALSFVQRPSDIIEARQLIGDRAAVMAKIEKPTALTHIDEILALVDSIMVARGDLGVEIPPEDVPGRQKELVRACRLAGKPVIIATQMLDSMVHVPAPTRAEASDVATAVYDGADAVMLSAESAAGDYPVKAVEMMSRIIQQTEKHKAYRSIVDALQPTVELSVPHAVSSAAGDVADTIEAAAIIAFTSSGTTASRVARKRPNNSIISITPHLHVARRLALLWGAHSVHSEDISSYSQMTEKASLIAKEEGFAKGGDQLVVVAGIPFGTPGSTNNLRVLDV